MAIDGSDEVGEIMTALRDAYCRLSSAWLRADCKYDMGGARVERRQCSPGDINQRRLEVEVLPGPTAMPLTTVSHLGLARALR